MIVNRNNFSEVYEKYKNAVYSVSYSYMRNPEDAMDVTQETFIKLLGYGEKFKNDEHMKAWLLRVAINHCKNLLRRQNYLSGEEISEDIPCYSEYESDDLLSHVLSLPEIYRIPIHLFYYEDYSVKQIAKVMDVPETTIKVRLKRGREYLSKTLVREDWNV